MNCSNPDCNRGIGLVAYRRGWFSNRRYCSRNCRDTVVGIDRVEGSHSEQTCVTTSTGFLDNQFYTRSRSWRQPPFTFAQKGIKNPVGSAARRYAEKINTPLREFV